MTPCRPLLLSLALAVSLLATAAGIAWAQPPNDDYANATTISSLPFSDSVDTTGAATGDAEGAEVLEACAASVPTAAGVWYRYTPPTDQVVAIDTSASTYWPGWASSQGSRAASRG